MRWILIDRFTKIEKGKIAQGAKSVTRPEQSIVDHYPCFPVMPSSLLIEMMAQIGGILAGASIDFSREVVLAKVTNAEFPEPVTPPAYLEIEATLGELGDDAAMSECVIRSQGRIVAKASIFFGLFAAMGEEGKKSVVFSENFMKTFAIREVMGQSV